MRGDEGQNLSLVKIKNKLTKHRQTDTDAKLLPAEGREGKDGRKRTGRMH